MRRPPSSPAPLTKMPLPRTGALSRPTESRSRSALMTVLSSICMFHSVKAPWRTSTPQDHNGRRHQGDDGHDLTSEDDAVNIDRGHPADGTIPDDIRAGSPGHEPCYRSISP